MKIQFTVAVLVCALLRLAGPVYGALVFEDDFAGTSIDAWWDYEFVNANPNDVATQNDVLTFTRTYPNQSTYWGRKNSGIGSGSDVLYVGFELSNYVYNGGADTNTADAFFRIASSNNFWAGADVAFQYNILQNGAPREGLYQIFLNNSVSNGVAYSHTNGISGTLDSQTWALYRDGSLVTTSAVLGGTGGNVAAGGHLTALGWGMFSTFDLLCSFDIDNFEVYDSLEVPGTNSPPPYWVGATLHDDFDNGNYRDVNSYPTGSANNFWSAQTQYAEDTPGSQLVQTIDSSGGNFKSANSTSGSYSRDFSFFDQTLTLRVRGISFDGTTGTGTNLTATQMQQWYAFMGNHTVALNAQDSLWLDVRGDGRIRVRSRIDGAYLGSNGSGNNVYVDEVTVANVTGFDLTLQPGVTGTDYDLTVYGDSTTQVSGNVSDLVKAAWGAGDGGTQLGLWAQETDGIQPGAGQSIMVATVGSYTITAITDPNISVTLPDQAGHKYRRTFYGANCLQMLSKVHYTLPGFTNLYQEAQKPFFRFPGGTPANFYNYETGFLDTTPEDSASRRATLDDWNASISNNWGSGGMKPDDFFEFANQNGADYSLTVNMTSFAPTNNRSYMQAIQALGATPKYIELGNELYFGSYDNYIEDGATYVAEAEAHANAMREVFPDAKYGALIPSHLYTSASFLPDPGVPNPDRQEAWYNLLVASNSFYDAVIIHLYSDLGMANNTPTNNFIPYEDAYKNCISHADSKLEGVMDTLGTDFPDKDIWVTEFHVGGFGGTVRDYRLRYSYLGAMYANYFFFKLLSEPQVTIADWHSFSQMFTVPSGTPDQNTVLGKKVAFKVFKTLGEYVERYGYFSPVNLSHTGTYEGSNGYNGTFDDLFACYLHSHTNGTLVLVNKLDNEYNLNSLSITNMIGDVTITGAKQVRPDDGQQLTDALYDEESLTIQTYAAGEVPGLSLPPYSVTFVDIDQDWVIDGVSEEVFVIEHSFVDLGNEDMGISYMADDGYGYSVERSLDLQTSWTPIAGSYYESHTSGLHTNIVDMLPSPFPKAFYRVIRHEL